MIKPGEIAVVGAAEIDQDRPGAGAVADRPARRRGAQRHGRREAQAHRHRRAGLRRPDDAAADGPLPRHHAEMGGRHRGRRLFLHAARPPRRRRHTRGLLHHRAHHPWRERQVARRRHAAPAGAGKPRRAVRDALRPVRSADALSHPRAALHEDLRRDGRGSGDGRRRAARMGGQEPARHVPRPDHGGRRAEQPHDRLPHAHPGVLPGDGRRRRADPDQRRPREGLSDQARLHPRHRRERGDPPWSRRWRTSPPRAPSGWRVRRRCGPPASRTTTWTTSWSTTPSRTCPCTGWKTSAS